KGPGLGEAVMVGQREERVSMAAVPRDDVFRGTVAVAAVAMSVYVALEEGRRVEGAFEAGGNHAKLRPWRLDRTVYPRERGRGPDRYEHEEGRSRRPLRRLTRPSPLFQRPEG